MHGDGDGDGRFWGSVQEEDCRERGMRGVNQGGPRGMFLFDGLTELSTQTANFH